jgi:hypothetical protein
MEQKRLVCAVVSSAVVACLAQAPVFAQCMYWDNSFASIPFNQVVLDFVTFDDGTGPALYVAADTNVYRWNGSGWTFWIWANDSIAALAVYDDGTGPQMYLAGAFTVCNGVPASGIARWAGGSNVSEVGGGVRKSGAPHQARRLLVHDDGSGAKLYVGGFFDSGGPQGGPLVFSRGILSWDGTTWRGYGGGVDSGSVYSITFYDDGGGDKLYLGGNFQSAGGVVVNGLGKWTGFRWAPVGDLAFSVPRAMTAYDDGTGPGLYANAVRPAGQSTNFFIGRWNGSTWSPVGGAVGTGGSVEDFEVFDDGSGTALYAAGVFGSSIGIGPGDVARWNGVTWSVPGSGVNDEVRTLHAHDDGSGPSLFLGGYFSQAGNVPSRAIARWRACLGPVDSMCFGDGTLAPCPCNNPGATGHGCENSASTGGALLQATGTTNPDTLVLTATDELPSALSIVLQGDVLLSGSAPFGDGLRCAGGHLRRLFVKSAVSGTVTAPEAGEPSITQRSAEKGDPISPGFVRTYQVYYRDPSPSFCAAPTGSTFNASNGIRVVW